MTLAILLDRDNDITDYQFRLGAKDNIVFHFNSSTVSSVKDIQLKLSAPLGFFQLPMNTTVTPWKSLKDLCKKGIIQAEKEESTKSFINKLKNDACLRLALSADCKGLKLDLLSLQVS